jgi:hypothetical protein
MARLSDRDKVVRRRRTDRFFDVAEEGSATSEKRELSGSRRSAELSGWLADGSLAETNLLGFTDGHAGATCVLAS